MSKAVTLLPAALVLLAACTYNYGPVPPGPSGAQTVATNASVPDYTNVQVDAEHRAWADGMVKSCVTKVRAQLPSRAASDGEVNGYCACVNNAVAMALAPEDMRYFMGHREYPERIKQMESVPDKQCRAKVFGS